MSSRPAAGQPAPRVTGPCSHCGAELDLDTLTGALTDTVTALNALNDALRGALHAAPVPDGAPPHLPSGDRGAALRPRQLEVAQLLGEGWRVPAIAARLGISVHTVRKHLQAIYTTLGVHSQAELVDWLRAGDVPAEPRLRAVGSHQAIG